MEVLRTVAEHQALAAAGVVLFFVLRRWIAFRTVVGAIGPNLPGYRSLIGLPIPFPFRRIPGVIVTGRWLWEQRFKPYEDAGVDMYTMGMVFPTARAGLTVGDPAVVKEITMSRQRFPKPTRIYRVLSVYGPNIVSSEFEEHKKFRKAVAPSFNERNNRLVWDETVKIVLGLFETPDWKGKSAVHIDHCIDITLPIALFVIGAAGFGRQVSWEDDDSTPPGHTMPFKEALNIASLNLHVRALLPKWLIALRSTWRHANIAFDELYLYMKEMIQDRKNSLEKGEHVDLFSGLLESADDPVAPLTDDELIGNVFIFLVAGHETTAHTLAFTFGLLALYDDEQEKLYQQIKSIVGPEGIIPGYEEMQRFTYSLAVFYETLRLYPPVTTFAKYAAEDTVLTTTATNPDGTHYPKQVFVPKNTNIGVNVVGLHYNPRYWDNPNEFRPERFMGDYPRDAFLPFAAGPRACIGRRFFETEGLAILTTLISRYKIKVKDKPEWVGLSVEEKREKLLQCRPIITLTPQQVPLIFERR